MRLFFSWQSDIPENKKLLRKLLQKLCKEFDIEYTDDTRDEAGGGHVVDALLRKIKNSHIFVGDITIVGKAINGDDLINSNVAYELGYAEAVIGRNGLLFVMNEEYGSYEDMPFDLGKRIITRFKTTEGSLTEEEVSALASDLKRKIKILTSADSGAIRQLESLNKAEKSLLYWAKERGDGHIEESYGREPDGLTRRRYRAGNFFKHIPLHNARDSKTKARLGNAAETLCSKNLLIKVGPSKWVLSDEGEMAAEAITESEVYPIATDI